MVSSGARGWGARGGASFGMRGNCPRRCGCESAATFGANVFLTPVLLAGAAFSAVLAALLTGVFTTGFFGWAAFVTGGLFAAFFFPAVLTAFLGAFFLAVFFFAGFLPPDVARFTIRVSPRVFDAYNNTGHDSNPAPASSSGSGPPAAQSNSSMV